MIYLAPPGLWFGDHNNIIKQGLAEVAERGRDGLTRSWDFFSFASHQVWYVQRPQAIAMDTATLIRAIVALSFNYGWRRIT